MVLDWLTMAVGCCRISCHRKAASEFSRWLIQRSIKTSTCKSDYYFSFFGHSPKIVSYFWFYGLLIDKFPRFQVSAYNLKLPFIKFPCYYVDKLLGIIQAEGLFHKNSLNWSWNVKIPVSFFFGGVACVVSNSSTANETQWAQSHET